jgi:hypothetical protein
MDIQWSDKSSRSIGSRRSVKEKEVIVYHRRSVQEGDAAATDRLANLEKELEAVEGMQQLGKGAKYDTRGMLPGYVPAQIQKEVTASLLLLRMKRGIQKLCQRVRHGPHFQGRRISEYFLVLCVLVLECMSYCFSQFV